MPLCQFNRRHFLLHYILHHNLNHYQRLNQPQLQPQWMPARLMMYTSWHRSWSLQIHYISAAQVHWSKGTVSQRYVLRRQTRTSLMHNPRMGAKTQVPRRHRAPGRVCHHPYLVTNDNPEKCCYGVIHSSRAQSSLTGGSLKRVLLFDANDVDEDDSSSITSTTTSSTTGSAESGNEPDTASPSDAAWLMQTTPMGPPPPPRVRDQDRVQPERGDSPSRWLQEPAPGTSSELLQALTKVVHALLQASFSQPNEEVTSLAYRACNYLTMMNAEAGSPEHPPQPSNHPRPGQHMQEVIADPTTTIFALDNPVIEAEATLAHMGQNYGELPRRHLYKELARIEQLLKDTKHVLVAWGRDPQAPGAHEGAAAIRNALNALDWLHLAIEEGNVAQIGDTIAEALHAVQRTKGYMEALLDWLRVKFSNTTGSPAKKRRATEKVLQVNLLFYRRHPTELYDMIETGKKAQGILKRIMPFAEQEIAQHIAEAHVLLEQWTTALWGQPIQLVDSADTESGMQDEQLDTALPPTLPEQSGEGTPLSQAETVPFAYPEETATRGRYTPFCDHDCDHSSDMSDESTFRADEDKDGLPEVLMKETTAECFNIPVFREQLLLHLLSPFCIPFYLLMGKRALLSNTQTWPCPNLVSLYWTTVPLIVYANAMLFVLFYDEFERNDIGIAEIVIVPCLAMFTHRSMIALKYSGLSPEEYALWLSAPRQIAAKWSKQMQLISTWLPVPDEILVAEIDKACKYQGADLHEIFFEHDVQDVSSWRCWQVWEQMLEGHCTNSELKSSSLCPNLTRVLSRETSVSFSRGLRRISAHQLLYTLYRRTADEVVEGQRFISVGLFALFPAIFPIAWRCVKCTSELGDEVDAGDILAAGFGRHSYVVSYCVAQAAFIAYSHGAVSSVFAVIAIIHYRRMQMVMDSVQQLARRLPCLYPNLPQVQLSGPTAEANVRAVLACFETVLRMGSRYQHRADSYIGALATASTMGLGLVLIGVILGAHSQLNAGTCVCLVIISGVTVAIHQMILYGRLANENFGKLSSNFCRARWRNSVTGDSEVGDQVMSLAMERLALLAETEPVTVACLIPTADLGYSIVSLVSTFVLYILGKLLHVELPL
ncbi:hypothetical protein AK812_SmicGene33236 [Symbiodinium microadriaticum]|uniref:Uncharacterized protein n=1 Tax=Symbiodinium microadriaticum TaxID=2951 RepID=A0A1Q9CS53_SYMMI|nr:hypothetical protein AK812_SmicGene33236 [Symbiodinium microadriaticum]